MVILMIPALSRRFALADLFKHLLSEPSNKRAPFPSAIVTPPPDEDGPASDAVFLERDVGLTATAARPPTPTWPPNSNSSVSQAAALSRACTSSATPAVPRSLPLQSSLQCGFFGDGGSTLTRLTI